VVWNVPRLKHLIYEDSLVTSAMVRFESAPQELKGLDIGWAYFDSVSEVFGQFPGLELVILSEEFFRHQQVVTSPHFKKWACGIHLSFRGKD
jgi:hypothetical protein